MYRRPCLWGFFFVLPVCLSYFHLCEHVVAEFTVHVVAIVPCCLCAIMNIPCEAWDSVLLLLLHAVGLLIFGKKEVIFSFFLAF